MKNKGGTSAPLPIYTHIPPILDERSRRESEHAWATTSASTDILLLPSAWASRRPGPMLLSLGEWQPDSPSGPIFKDSVSAGWCGRRNQLLAIITLLPTPEYWWRVYVGEGVPLLQKGVLQFQLSAPNSHIPSHLKNHLTVTGFLWNDTSAFSLTISPPHSQKRELTSD